MAMTGEITLRGLVLPVGGIKEKVLAAHRAGIKRVILPERNRKDLIDVPEQAKKDIEFIFVTQMDEVLAQRPGVRPVQGPRAGHAGRRLDPRPAEARGRPAGRPRFQPDPRTGRPRRVAVFPMPSGLASGRHRAFVGQGH